MLRCSGPLTTLRDNLRMSEQTMLFHGMLHEEGTPRRIEEPRQFKSCRHVKSNRFMMYARYNSRLTL